MRTIACRCLLVLAILGFDARISFGQTVNEPLSDRELLALVAGNALSENIVHEIETRGLAFRPGDQFRSLVTEAGADSPILAALNKAKTGEASAPGPNDGTGKLLEHLAGAGKFLKNKQYDEATRELTAALQNGGAAETGFVMGEVLRAQGQWPSAEEIFREVQHQSPDFPEAHTKLSFILYRMQDGEGALREARIALAENQNNAEAHKNAGLALDNLRRYDASEQEYLEALRLKPDYAAARADLGLLFANKGSYDQAIPEYKKAIALGLDDAVVRYNLGVAYDNKGDLDSAIREYREAKRLDPKMYDPRQNLGHDLIQHRMYAEAVKEFRELETIAPDSAMCHDCLGGALYATGDFDGGEKEYRKAIALDPTDALSHRGLGRIRQLQKDYDAALNEFRTAEKLDDTAPQGYLGAGQALLSKRDFAQAAKELKKAEYLGPSNPDAHEYLGQALSGMGDINGAIVEFKQAVALDPKQAQIRLELAAALENNGDWIEALDQYHHAAMADLSPATQDQYKTAQRRFNQYLAALKASGKSEDAALLEKSLHESKVEPGISEKLDELMQKGEQALMARHFEEAGKDYKDAVDLAGKLQPPDDRLSNALMRLAGYYGTKNDFAQAEVALLRALKVTGDLHGPESPAMTLPLQEFGRYSIFRHDFNSAVDYFSRAVAVNEKAFGEQSDKVAMSLNYLASVYVIQQDYPKAEPLLLRAVRIDESLYGANASATDLGLVLWPLCDLYNKWNKPEKAEPRYQQMLGLLEKQYGPDSPVLISTLDAEAKMLHQLGRAEEAGKYERRAQAIRAAVGQPEGEPQAQLPN
jgi:tetratricopeptide (TPR) repeat protein